MTVVRSALAIARGNRHRRRLCAAVARDDPEAGAEPELCLFHATVGDAIYVPSMSSGRRGDSQNGCDCVKKSENDAIEDRAIH